MPTKYSDLDWGDAKNSFYKKYFTQKKDALTDRFREVIDQEYYIEHLPIAFFDGLPNLEEKVKIPLKNIPTLAKLLAGAYETKFTQSDKSNTKNNIQFFINNLPSFRQYKHQPNLDWVITKHRLLAIEIIDYYKNKNPSLSTLENRFNAILRMMRIAYGNKLAPVYKLFSVMVFLLHDAKLYNEGDNELNIYEAKKYINWLDVIKIQQTMEDEFDSIDDKYTQKAYDLNNDLLLISLYSLIPPLRNEIKNIEFTTKKYTKGHVPTEDHIFISKNKQNIILFFNKKKKLHKKIQFDLTTGKFKNVRLANIIRESYTLYPRDYPFTIKQAYPDLDVKASQRALDERLIYIFFKHGISNKISVNSLRSSYVSYTMSQKDLTYNEKELLAYQMRTSVECLERSYNKVKRYPPILVKKPPELFDEEDESLLEQPEDQPEDQQHNTKPYDEPVPVSNQYEKKLKRGRDYYAKNKQKLKEAQKKYKANMTAFEKTRERLMQLLNASEDYAKKMRDSTKEKYKFVYDEVLRKWKWLED